MSPDQIASKKATVNRKNEKDNKRFRWSIILGLNYNEINKKYFKRIEKLERDDIDLSSHQRDWEELE